MNRFILILVTLMSFQLMACGGGGQNPEQEDETDTRQTDLNITDPVEVANIFGSNVLFEAGTFQSGPPPVPDFTLNQEEVEGGTVIPGQQASVSPDFQNITNGLSLNANVTVNVTFSGGVPGLASGFTAINTSVADINGGSFNGNFSVPANICDNLADISHQIRCYESVTLPDGTVVSTSQARNMVLACDGSGSAGGTCPQQCPQGKTCVAGVCVGQGALRFSLTWSAVEDLDLYVVTPGGSEISYSNSQADGGVLDVDNTEGGQNSVENIFFDSAPPGGTYTYYVNNFSGGSASWQIQVAMNGTVVVTKTGSFGVGGDDESTHFSINL